MYLLGYFPIAQVITLREVKSPIHFHHSQELQDDIKEIKATVSEIKQLIEAQSAFHHRSQSFYFQPQPQPHYQPPSIPAYPNYEPPWLQEDYTPPPLPPTLPALTTDQEDIPELTTSFLMNLRLDSCSRANFAAKLARSLFSEEERKTSNVKGVLGKKKLDPKRMLKIKENVFQIWPCETGETQLSSWSQCCKAIDEAGRRLSRTTRVM